jgi:parvulin-like peptidyl-prolyl isomerase
MSKKKKLVSQAPVPLTRGQLSRRAREQQRIRNLYTAGIAAAVLVTLILGFAVINTFVLRPNAQVAKVGDTTITRSDYNKFRRYNLYQQIQNAAILQDIGAQQGASAPGQGNLLDLQRAMANVENEATLDADTVNQMIDNEVLRQGASRDFSLNPSKEQLKEFAYKDFLPSPTPPVTPTSVPGTPGTETATVAVTPTATGTQPTSTPTRTPTAGSPTLTPTASATLPPVAGGQETAVALYNRYSAALDGDPEPNPNSSYCIYGCPDISQDDFLKIAFEQRYLQQQVTDKLAATEVLTEVAQLRVQHILTDTQVGAQSIITQVNSGIDFTKLANEQSKEQLDRIAQGQQPNGGIIEWFPEKGSNLVEPFVKCSFATEVGKVSAPCQTEFGWHVIKVLEKDPSRPRDQTQIDTLRSQVYTTWFDKLKQEYQSANRIQSSVPPRAVVPTQPAIVEPTSPPVQPQTPATTPGASGTITGTNPLTDTAPTVSPPTQTAPTTPGRNTTPTTGTTQ